MTQGKKCPNCGAEFFQRDEPKAQFARRKCCGRECGYAMLRNTPEKFWAKIDKSGECWLFVGPKMRGGYGHVVDSGRHMNAQRYAWIVTHGDPARNSAMSGNRSLEGA